MKKIRCVIIDLDIRNDDIDALVFAAMSKVEFKDGEYTFFIGTTSINTSTAPRLSFFKSQALTDCLKVDKRIEDALEAFSDKSVDVIWCISSLGGASNLTKFIQEIYPRLPELKKAKKIIMGCKKSDTFFETLELRLEGDAKLMLLPGIENTTIWQEVHQKILKLIPAISKEKVGKVVVGLEEQIKKLRQQETSFKAQIQELELERDKLEGEISILSVEITKFNQVMRQIVSPAVQDKKTTEHKIKMLEDKRKALTERLKICTDKLATIRQSMKRIVRKIKCKQISFDTIQMPSELKQYIEQLTNDTDDKKMDIVIPVSFSLTQEGASELIQILILCPEKISGLTIAGIPIPRNIVENLAELFKQPDLELVTLNLSRCQLDDVTIRPLLESLAECPGKLRSLDLRNNTLSLESGRLLGNFVAKSPDIQTLLLENNQLNDEGIIALSTGLSKYGAHAERALLPSQLSLSSIDIKNNNMGPSGLSVLIDVLIKNSNLSQLKSSLFRYTYTNDGLKIYNNPLTDESIEILAPLISQATSINLDGCSLSDKGVIKLCELLLKRGDKAGVTLFLHNNRFSKATILAIANVYKQQPYRLQQVSLADSLSDLSALLDLLPDYIHADAMHYVNFEVKNCKFTSSLIQVTGGILGNAGVIKLCDLLLQRMDKKRIELLLHSDVIGKPAILALANLYKQQPYRLSNLSLKNSITDSSLLLDLFPDYAAAAIVHQSTIDLTECNLTSEVLKEILPLMMSIPTQSTLDFQSNVNLGDTNLIRIICDALERNSNFASRLHTLNLYRIGNLINLDALVVLIQAKKLLNLQNINLGENNLNDAELSKLISILPLLKSPIWIHIYWNNFSLHMLKAFLEAALALKKENKSLQILAANYHLTAQDAKNLVKEFPDVPINTILTSHDDRDFFKQLKLEFEKSNFAITVEGLFNLQKRQLSDNHVAELLTLLNTQSNKIITLNLSDNAFTGEGFKQFVEGYFLKDESRIAALKTVDLSKNPLTDSVKSALLELLRHPKCNIEKLSLEATCITDLTLKPLIPYLGHIKNLNVSGNVLSKEFFEGMRKQDQPVFPSKVALYRSASVSQRYEFGAAAARSSQS